VATHRAKDQTGRLRPFFNSDATVLSQFSSSWGGALSPLRSIL